MTTSRDRRRVYGVVRTGRSGGAGRVLLLAASSLPRFGCSLWPATRNDTVTLKQRGGSTARKRGKGDCPPRPRCLSVGAS